MHSAARLEQLRRDIFGAGAVDEPPIPELKPEVRAANLAIIRDASGRRALAQLAKLPFGQQLAILAAAHRAAPTVRLGRSHTIGRADLTGAELPRDSHELDEALLMVREDVAPSLWFRRLVATAWALWGHRRRLGRRTRRSARGGVYVVEGFCERALAWLVPKADGTLWSRSVLFGPAGPFSLLGSKPRRLGKANASVAGLGLYLRWQPPYWAARFKGPWRTNARTGERERFALSQHRYDRAMSGPTASSLAQRSRSGFGRLARRVLGLTHRPQKPLADAVVVRTPRRVSARTVRTSAPSALSMPPGCQDARPPP